MTALANPSVWYIGSDKYASVTAWSASASTVAGALRRQLTTPAVGSERVFAAIIAGTTNSTEPTWVVTKGAKTTDNTVTWIEITGQPGVNGDTTNSTLWGASLTTTLGQTIYEPTSASIQVVTTAGTNTTTKPTFSATAGVTTTDGSTIWTSLGLASGFAAFAAPHARTLNADAATWSTIAGSKFFDSSTQAETAAQVTALAGGQGTVAAANKYLSVSPASAPPTSVTAGASISVTGAFNLSVGSSKPCYFSGFTFNCGSAANVAALVIGNSAGTTICENCTFNLMTTDTTGSNISMSGGDPGNVILYNCTMTFGATAQHLNSNNAATLGGTMIGGSIALTGTVPSTLFAPGTNKPCNVLLRGVDLSAITGTLVAVGSWTYGTIELENCKLAAGVTPISGTFVSPNAPTFRMRNCDSGSKNYRFYEANSSGTIQQETTTIRTGGASDNTQGVSWNIATSANTQTAMPYILEYLPIIEWQDTTGSAHTATVEIAGANTLTNGDIWLELEYPGNASYPISSITNNRVTDVLTTVGNVTTSTASWGGSPAVTQKLQVIFTPQMKGPIKARVCVAKPSITVYVDPLITIS